MKRQTARSLALVQTSQLMSEPFRSVNVRVPTPDGTMYVTIMENENRRPFQILINIGKAGTSVSAWADALSRIVSKLFETGVGVNEIIEEFSLMGTDKVARMDDGSQVHSGPEGVAVALMRYRSGKFQELKEQLGVVDSEEEEDGRPTIGR